jgi:hypothetical protein
VKARFSAAVVLLTLALLPAFAQAPRTTGPHRGIKIESQSIDHFDSGEPARVRFGALTFRGGLVLNSPDPEFGGISGLKVAPDGASFLAITDKGNWLRARIIYRDDRPIAIRDAEMAPMLGADGNPLNRRGWYDSEAFAEDGGTVYVAFERVNRIVRFNFGRDGLQARAQPVAIPPAVRSLPNNRGLECLAVAPRRSPLVGALIAISERGLDSGGNIQGFLIGGKQPGSFAIKRTDEFDVSDCALTPNGDLLILERRFSWLRGVAMRIRRLPLGEVQPGALLDGPTLIFADMGQQIDNMEGLSVHRTADGALVLTLISDDNFSQLQRTVLLQFTLAGE